MNEIRKVVSTLWYDKDNYHTLRNVFPNAEFVYVDFMTKKNWSRKQKTQTWLLYWAMSRVAC